MPDPLLVDLLNTDIEDTAELRPVVLQSPRAWRRGVLHGFLLRNWVDHTLLWSERVLTLVLIGFFAWWLFASGGAAWLNQQAGLTASGSSATVPLVPLPYERVGTHADMYLVADYLDPRSIQFLPAAVSSPPAVATPVPPITRRSGDYFNPQAIGPPVAVVQPQPQRLRIPSIGVDTPVQEVFVVDGAWQVAEFAAGYHYSSALPGTNGNTVMAGHAGLHGAVFARLGAINLTDLISVEAGGWVYTYHVREIKSVWPTQVEVMAPTDTPVLTLITCTAWDTQRLVVVADQVDARPIP